MCFKFRTFKISDGHNLGVNKKLILIKFCTPKHKETKTKACDILHLVNHYTGGFQSKLFDFDELLDTDIWGVWDYNEIYVTKTLKFSIQGGKRSPKRKIHSGCNFLNGIA